MNKVTLKEKDERLVEVIENEGMVGVCWSKAVSQAKKEADGHMLKSIVVELFTDEVADFILHTIQDNVKDVNEKERLLNDWDNASWKKIVKYLISEYNLEVWG